ncbi:MAG: hypothetical protein Q4E16_06305 [Neisseria sp.]|nr:hypothetical protein [Neisseria sp.]
MKYIIFLFFSLFTHFSFASTVPELTPKAIFREFYSDKDMFPLYFSEEEKEEYQLNGLSYVGIREKKEEYALIYHGVYPYQNHLGEKRYLIALEQKVISDTDGSGYGFPDTCHACNSTTHLISFKEHPNTGYKLLAKAQFKNGSYGNSSLFKGYGESSIFKEYDENAGSVLENGIRNIVKLGNDKVGFFYEDAYMSQGFYSGFLSVIILSENKIQSLEVTEHEGQPGYEEDYPLFYSFKSTWSVDESNPDLAYYPIKVRFTGEYYNEKLKKPRIMNKNITEIYVYDPANRNHKYKLKYTEPNQ